ncbi:hypothetical protein PFISCL1PPCAC_6974, partial [Pristionchus fissidentatus]
QMNGSSRSSGNGNTIEHSDPLKFTLEMRLSLNFVLISLTRVYYAAVYIIAVRYSGTIIKLLLVLSSFISYS